MQSENNAASDRPASNLHGEYKVPGGKLVVVDLTVENRMLANVRVSGDFFLEPPEALDAINFALAGLPADASEQQFAAAVSEALPKDVEMFGFSAEAVAVTLRRALG